MPGLTKLEELLSHLKESFSFSFLPFERTFVMGALRKICQARTCIILEHNQRLLLFIKFAIFLSIFRNLSIISKNWIA